MCMCALHTYIYRGAIYGTVGVDGVVCSKFQLFSIYINNNNNYYFNAKTFIITTTITTILYIYIDIYIQEHKTKKKT